MLKKNTLILSIIAVIITLVLSACGSDSSAETDNSDAGTALGDKDLSMPYAAWASTEASVGVMKNVLEDIGYNVNLKQVEAGPLFAGIAQGSGDLSVGAATLPSSHASYWKKYKDDIVDVHKSLDGEVQLGLAVPEYMDIDSIEDLNKNKNNVGKKLEWEITGIDPGAGVVDLAKNEAKPAYDLDDWEVNTSSESAMAASLDSAIANEEPIVTTIYEPHWVFLEYDLKFWDDPENSFGKPENIHSMAREGLKEDSPAAYKVLSQFEWTADDVSDIMLKIRNDMSLEEAGREWVDNHQEQVDEWTKGVKNE